MKLAPLCLAICALIAGVSAQTAVCVLRPTRLSPDQDLSGYFTFEAIVDGSVNVSYSIDGLADGGHAISVHTYGSLHSTDGTAVGPVFPGNSTEEEEAVGLIGDGADIAASNGTSSGSFLDEGIAFVGVNSIIGRGLVVFGDGTDNSTVVAQCAIGRNDEEGDFNETVVSNTEGVIEADCILSSVGEAAGTRATGYETGHVRFFQRDDGLDVEIWAAGLVSDGRHPFGIYSQGNIVDKGTQGSLFVGNYSGEEGDRTAVGELGPSTSLHRGVLVNTNFGSWSFVDQFASLNGENSIIGRSFVLFSPITSENVSVAHCVVGIVSESEDTLDTESVGISRAHAIMDPISEDDVVGTVDFVRTSTGDIQVKYFFFGLTPGDHIWHIHRVGDLSSDDGSALLGHFIGDCSVDDPCREEEERADDEPQVLQEVGAIEGNAPIVANELGEAFGVFDDPVITLDGDRSVVGRGIIVHDVDPAIRVSQGVIGRATEVETVPDQLPVFAASCVLQPTGLDSQFNAGGYVLFSRPQGGDLIVNYSITGVETNASLDWGIYESGNLFSIQDGISVGDRFIGNVDREEGDDEVGAIQNGVQLTTDSDGAASGSFVDNALAFEGENSIIGRSLVVKSSDGIDRVAICSIGILEEEEDQGLFRAVGVQATCSLRATRLSDSEISGFLTFTQTADNVEISYAIRGLADGEHGIHVHSYGSLHSTDGSATGPHFPGTCSDDNPCRPDNATEQTVGYIGNGFEIESIDGAAEGSFTDDVIEFIGVNSIIGRGFIVHGDGTDSGARVAQCVIGRDFDEEDFTVEEASNSAGVTEADCIMFTPTDAATTRATGAEIGHARFFTNTEEGGVDVEIWIDNLRNDGLHPFLVHDRGDLDASVPEDEFFVGEYLGEAPRTSVGALGPDEELNDGIKIADSFGAWVFNDQFASLNGVNSLIGRQLVFFSSIDEDDRAIVAQCIVGIVKENDLPAGVLDLTVDLTVEAEVDGGVVLLEDSMGSGSADVVYDPNSRLLSWTIDVQNLSSAVVQTHFHGPAGRLEGGALQINATALDMTFQGEAFITEAQGRDILNGLWYINVHTELNPSGELRGQVSESVLTYSVALTVDAEQLGGVVLLEDSLGSGTALVEYDPILRVLSWDITVQDLSSDLMQVHFHGPATRFVGGALQVNATDLNMTLQGETTLTAEQGRALIGGLWYINVHTDSNPSGELRGQIAEAVGISRAHAVTSAISDTFARGTVDFVREEGTSAITVRYFFSGLDPGDHIWHIHLYGDITSDDGSAQASHFIGDCSDDDPCRPSGLQEVGAIEDSAPITADDSGNAYGVFDDSVIQFEGVNSIIGRGLIVHGVDPAIRVTQGVIGVATENTPLDVLVLAVDLSPGAVTLGGVALAEESNGTGTAAVTLDVSTMELTWSLAFEGLTSDATRAAFHGPANRSAVADEQIVIEEMTFVSPSEGTAIVTSEQASGILSGLWYINIDTTNNPDGELRAQVAEALPLALNRTVDLSTAATEAGGTILDATSTATGSALATYDANSGSLSWLIEVSDLSSDISQVLFRGPALRLEEGDIQIDVSEQGLEGETFLTGAQGQDLIDGLWYFSIATENNPDGELRGQIAEEEEVFILDTITLTSEAVERGGVPLLVPSDGFAEIDITYDANFGLFGWGLRIDADSLTGEATSATFHAPAGPTDNANAIPVPITLVGGVSSLESVTLTQMMSDILLQDLWYIQVNTEMNPDGELRAQIEFNVDDEIVASPDLSPIEVNESDDTDTLAAVCVITPTSGDSLVNAGGYVLFSRSASDSDVTVEYQITGLEVGTHEWNIHQLGNIMSNHDGLSTGSVVIGDVDRPGTTVDFLGALNNGEPIDAVGTSVNGIAEGTFVDSLLQFGGTNSIIGRSVVIQSVDGTEREAQCTIGIQQEQDDEDPVVNPTDDPDATAGPAPEGTDEVIPDDGGGEDVTAQGTASMLSASISIHIACFITLVAAALQ